MAFSRWSGINLVQKMSSKALRASIPTYMTYKSLYRRADPYVVVGWHAQKERALVPFLLLKVRVKGTPTSLLLAWTLCP